MKYKIAFGKDLKAGDVIIDDYHKAEILEVTKGMGMGSFDFGEYMHIKLKKQRKFWFSKVEKKMAFQECPIIKLEED